MVVVLAVAVAAALLARAINLVDTVRLALHLFTSFIHLLTYVVRVREYRVSSLRQLGRFLDLVYNFLHSSLSADHCDSSCQLASCVCSAHQQISILGVFVGMSH